MYRHNKLVSDSALRRRARVDLGKRLKNIEDVMCMDELPPDEVGESVIIDAHSAVDGDVDHVDGAVDYGFFYDDHGVADSESDCSHGEMSDSEEGVSLTSRLSNWALTYGISHTALTALLAILCFYHPELPRDARTILHTKISYTVKELCNGLYHYFGIKSAIAQTLSRLKDTLVSGSCLRLQINIDGLPLFKSSNLQLWPILGLLVTVPMKEPVVIGLFSGNKKPDSCIIFLEDFVTELEELQRGFEFEGKCFTLRLDSVICDTPARSFVKNTKSHNGYHGCDKCIQNGVYINNRMTYPLVDSAPRTDEVFSMYVDEGHHHGPHPFAGINVGLVSQFPLDYMHLVCLGVVRRLINLWLKGPLKFRLPSHLVGRISDKLVNLRAYIPDEFARKPRSLREVDRWKATEFRQFLLYTGPVVLCGILDPVAYYNFMLLSMAIAILVSPKLVATHAGYANTLLQTFVTHYGDLYGKDLIVYNVHGLLHLAQDCKNFGCLDSISAFPFENYLGKLKRFVRKPSHPLAQIIRRLSEETSLDPKLEPKPNLRKEHSHGPVPVGPVVREYAEMKSEYFTIKIQANNNTFVIENKVCRVSNIIECRDGVYVAYNEFTNSTPFFSYPFDSSSLNIVCVSQLHSATKFTKVSGISQKCVALPYQDKLVVIPLFHTEN